MTVPGDIHTHVWERVHFSSWLIAEEERVFGEGPGAAGYSEHMAHAAGAKRSVVLALDAPHVGLVVPNEYVASYVEQDPRRFIGFASVDPARPDARERLIDAVDNLRLRGVKLSPTYQGFHPSDPRVDPLYREAAERGLPTMWHQGATFISTAKLANALPRDLDPIAIRYPELRIVVAHMGAPWIQETVALVRKHKNVFADISTLGARPTLLRQALVAAGEARVAHKLLFGTDFPVTTIADTLAALTEAAADEQQPPAGALAAESLLRADPFQTLGIAPEITAPEPRTGK
jgi:predicted TIM-barrel fold metal-dependent hydrolase